MILIPAYEPDQRLIELVKNLQEKCSYPILIVNDGSNENYDAIFQSAEELGCTVLHHAGNQGKGTALKTGFHYLKAQHEIEGVVCADCDGQHLPEDIIKVAREVQQRHGYIVLGSRRFVGRVPLKSRVGNTFTRMIFAFVTGTRIMDTQTGLRGYSADMLDWLCSIPGEHFEYEMTMLLEAPAAGFHFQEVEINTVYAENHSTHFHALKDSVRVFRPVVKFCTSSLLSAGIDFALLMILGSLTSSLLFAVVAARTCSSLFNYTMNKYFVFARNHSGMKQSFVKYFALVIVILFFNYQFLAFFHQALGIPLFYAKILTETVLFLFSYWMQRVFVFRTHQVKNKMAGTDGAFKSYSVSSHPLK